jgi:hypothetical protein
MLDARKWVDPRTIDWTDPFNPLARNGWRYETNPYVDMIFEHPIWVAIRGAGFLEPRLLTVPDQQNTTIAAGATYDQAITAMDPNSWLLGVSTYSVGVGFYLQITDSQTGKLIWSSPVLSQNAGVGNANTQTQQKGTVCYLAVPHCFVPPAYPIVRIINNNPTQSQFCQVVLWTAAEMDLSQ